jgi:serine protease Do
MNAPGSNVSSPKLLASAPAKLKLIVAAVATLAAGLAFSPPRRATTLGAPQERAAPLLEQQVQPRIVRRPFDEVPAAVARARGFALAIWPDRPAVPPLIPDVGALPPRAGPRGFAVRVSPTHALTHVDALEGQPTVRLEASSGAVVDARVAGFDAETGIVALETDPDAAPPPAIAADAPSAGALLVGVADDAGRERVAPVFVVGASAARLDLGGAADALRPGMPLFDLQGALAGIAAGVGDAAVPMTAAMSPASAPGGRPPTGGIGATFQPLTGRVTEVFGERGALVCDLAAGGPAAAAGVIAGDVLVAVGASDVASPDDARRVLQSLAPGAVVELRLRRRGRDAAITVTAASEYSIVAGARARGDVPITAPEARLLFDAATLAAAALPPEARVLSINGRAVSSRLEADRVRRAARGPAAVLISAGASRFFTVVDGRP